MKKISLILFMVLSVFLQSCCFTIQEIGEHDEELLNTYFSSSEVATITANTDEISGSRRTLGHYDATSICNIYFNSSITIYNDVITESYESNIVEYTNELYGEYTFYITEEQYRDIVVLHEFCHALYPSCNHEGKWTNRFGKVLEKYAENNGFSYKVLCTWFLNSYKAGYNSFFFYILED